MSTRSDNEEPPASSGLVGKTGVGRRRLLRAGVSATPVMLALSGRSAMAAGICADLKVGGLSPMAWASLAPDGRMCAALSHTVGRNEIGKSPGFWRPNPNGNTFQTPPWPASVVTPFGDYIEGMAYSDILWNDSRWATGTKFNSKFPDSSDSRSFSRILIDESGDNPNSPNGSGNINWFLCAAYLNALVIPGYALTLDEVVKIQNGTLQIKNLNGFLKQTWA